MSEHKDWYTVPMSHIDDHRGCLSVVEQCDFFDFDIKRAFFLSKVAQGDIRGEHAHEELNQIIFMTSGSLKIVLDNGDRKEELHLKIGDNALFVSGLVWRTMYDFSEDAVMVVLCDRIYSDDKVIRNYDEFIGKLKNE